MKTLPSLLVKALFLLAVAAALLVTASLALATNTAPPIRVPGPSTLALLSVGAAAAAIAVRWIRRR
ncbi:MAG TPA: PEP-CTERM sorting domain-containing protein [Methylomirabilota bacterium]|nr:PEP-CTERM sorting domain-containing protein [Methylomirabilota bacterium]